jgi:sorbose reductase
MNIISTTLPIHREHNPNSISKYHGNKKAIEKAADIEKKYNVKCRAYQTDVTSFDSISTTVTDIVKDFNGRLDIVSSLHDKPTFLTPTH